MAWSQSSLNIVDLLKTAPSPVSFRERVLELELSYALTEKVLAVLDAPYGSSKGEVKRIFLSRADEQELATEVLLYRHRFTNQVFQHRPFCQAVLTVIQNIYLFRQRKIFFGTSAGNNEQERQEALLLFSRHPEGNSIPLAKTFQHLILARVWGRIVSQASAVQLQGEEFAALHQTVERLNSLRNIYMLLCGGLVRKLVQHVNTIYRQSITPEDAQQIGHFGIARAAYRYHPSIGVRFSTYAAHWVQKEIQRQALQGRLIKVSAHTVEHFARSARQGDQAGLARVNRVLADATPMSLVEDHGLASSRCSSPADKAEARQQKELLLEAVGSVLSAKSGDIIRRRYGLPPYDGHEHSVIEIARIYGVTRSSIYQMEQAAFAKLRKRLATVPC